MDGILTQNLHEAWSMSQRRSFPMSGELAYLVVAWDKPNFVYMARGKNLLIHEFMHSHMYWGFKTKETLNYKRDLQTSFFYGDKPYFAYMVGGKNILTLFRLGY